MKIILFLLVFCASAALADTSSTIAIVSDYSFNGVSQTDNNPALQGSIDYAGEDGFYAGSWASNVDFGEGTNVELDFYAGYVGEIKGITYDAALLYYTYHGASNSGDIDYPEIKIALSKGSSNLSFWYSWDYAGTEAGHYVTAFSHSFTFANDWSLVLGVDRSASLNGNKFTWEGSSKDYIHYYARGNYSFSGFDLFITLEDTDLETFGEPRIVAGVSRTFNF